MNDDGYVGIEPLPPSSFHFRRDAKRASHDASIEKHQRGWLAIADDRQ